MDETEEFSEKLNPKNRSMRRGSPKWIQEPERMYFKFTKKKTKICDYEDAIETRKLKLKVIVLKKILM